MHAIALTTALFLGALPAQKGDGESIELFAKEEWYKNTKSEVQDFVGVLRKTERGKGIVGFGRNNPFRLEMEGNKVREVYVGGKPNLLDPYVGKKIKLVGKAVDMEVEGRQHHEIWAASLVVLQGDKKEVGKVDGLKIYANTPTRIGAVAGAIKSAEQLGKLINAAPDRASADVAKLLRVDAIDWKKQMLIVIQGGTQRLGGYSVEAQSLEVKDGKLIVNWKLNTPGPGSIVTPGVSFPAATILVDRFEGEITFIPASPPAGVGKKLGRVDQ